MKKLTRHALDWGQVGLMLLAPLLADAQSATFSLADDFSYTDNQSTNTWSYRLDDYGNIPAVFPLLRARSRNANEVWGSNFPSPPLMWSEASGYWGIGRNLSGQDQVSTVNGTRWAPGEVLLHPKAGALPSGLVVAWTAPTGMVIEVHYNFAPAARAGNGIGFEIIQRTGGSDRHVVYVANIGNGITNDLNSIVLNGGDQLFFRFNNSGDAGGDISRAGIVINGRAPVSADALAPQPSGGTGDFTFVAPALGGGLMQWRKNGQPIPGATSPSYKISAAKMADGGTYSVVAGSTASTEAVLKVLPMSSRPEPYASPVPRQVFSPILSEQEAQLKTNELMLRFAASRKKLAADRYRPVYHFVSPESQMNDPNGLCFWQGRWHLFYQAYPPDEYPAPADIPKRRQHWGHAVSLDLAHWRDLPYAIYPGTERMCFSGSTVVESNQVVAFYPGIAAGQMVAISSDPLLLNWRKTPASPVNSPSGDSCIWKEGDTYYGLVGADHLVSSKDLANWNSHGTFMQGSPFPLGDAAARPGFVPIGNKHLLVSFSHALGGQYLLGDYNPDTHQFKPYAMGRFNHGGVSPGGVHAPSAAPDGRGGVINILNINDGKHSDDWDQVMSLAQRLTLGPDAQLRIAPVEAIGTLRGRHQHVDETALPANQEIVLHQVQGSALELDVEIDPGSSRWVRLNLLRSPHAEERTSITFYNFDRVLSYWYGTPGEVVVDGSGSSTLPEVWLRPPERAPMQRAAGEPLRLRVFVDRSVVEVFVNERQYLAMRVYPGREDSVGVSLQAQGQEALLRGLNAWTMNPMMPEVP